MTNKTTDSNIHILLVEDDNDCREFIAMSLECEGITVTQCTEAEQAVEILKSSSIDAVVTDICLPCMDGIALLEHIRKNSEIPVIMITGHSSIQSAIETLKLGANDYLIKPFENGTMVTRAVTKAVEHHRLKSLNKELEKKLATSEKIEQLGRLAGGVAHDLNNILTPVFGLPDVMLDDLKTCETSCATASQLKDDLQLMKASIERAVNIVGDMLALSRRTTYVFSDDDINSIVTAFMKSQEFIEMTGVRKHVVIETNMAFGLPSISASSSHLFRILCNLMRNGLEAIDDSLTVDPQVEARLTIRTSSVSLNGPMNGFEVIPPGEYVLLQVEDNGIGITSDNLAKICEPFFTHKKQGSASGTGLGLTVVQGIIKDHHGFLDIKSRSGKGSIFSIYFPAVETDVINTTTEKTEETYHGGTEHVLIVDDEPSLITMAERFLKKLGYTMAAAPDGHAALDLIKSKSTVHGDKSCPFDLIIIDMIMKDGFDGLDTMKTIKAIYPDQKIIISSGYAPTKRIQTALHMGAGWLPKPYQITDLAKALRAQIDT